MRIGLLVLSIGDFGKKGFYNLQEVGLARELDPLYDEVLICRLVGRHDSEVREPLDGCRNTTLRLLPAHAVGSNGIPPLKELDASIDALVCFSDTQLFFPSVYRWCQKHRIRLIPYIGVSRSHSSHPVKQKVMDWLFSRNLRLYKKLTCLAKTPGVRDELAADGVSDVITAPVGLDMTRLKPDADSVSPDSLKSRYGFASGEKVILFIGRMTAEKQPLRMIEIFREVLRRDSSFRLLMVGDGELSDDVDKCIGQHGLSESVTRLPRIPNSEIWELYRLSDCFVNLNRQEIYGMVLLEAMYYGCKVIAWHAPGPDFIIRDNVTGYLVGSNEQAYEHILDSVSLSQRAKAAVISDFSWKKTAGLIRDLTE